MKHKDVQNSAQLELSFEHTFKVGSQNPFSRSSLSSNKAIVPIQIFIIIISTLKKNSCQEAQQFVPVGTTMEYGCSDLLLTLRGGDCCSKRWAIATNNDVTTALITTVHGS